MEPDTQSYVAVMTELKRRISVIDGFLNGQCNALYREAGVEAMVLQIRLTLELIALGSIAVNKSLFEQNRKKFADHWNLADILRDVKKLNPHFYPKPVKDTPSSQLGIKAHLDDIKDGFLRENELVEIHGRCGNLLHASNPYGKHRDYDSFERVLPSWRGRIVKLLDTHLIRLLDDDRIYLVQMDVQGKPSVSTFQRRGA